MMHSRRAQRARLPIGTVVLLLAVFGWALHCQGSRFRAGKHLHASSRNPVKMLTDAERTGAAKLDARPHGTTSEKLDGGAQAVAAAFDCAGLPCESAAVADSRGVEPETESGLYSLLRAPPKA